MLYKSRAYWHEMFLVFGRSCTMTPAEVELASGTASSASNIWQLGTTSLLRSVSPTASDFTCTFCSFYTDFFLNCECLLLSFCVSTVKVNFGWCAVGGTVPIVMATVTHLLLLNSLNWVMLMIMMGLSSELFPMGGHWLVSFYAGEPWIQRQHGGVQRRGESVKQAKWYMYLTSNGGITLVISGRFSHYLLHRVDNYNLKYLCHLTTHIRQIAQGEAELMIRIYYEIMSVRSEKNIHLCRYNLKLQSLLCLLIQ